MVHVTERIVLDSWAIMAWAHGEPAGSFVRDLMNSAAGNGKSATHLSAGNPRKVKLFINMVNLGEVFYLTGRRKGEEAANEIINEIQAGPIHIVSASDALVLQAAWLKMKRGVDYADAFCVATALLHEAKLATGDPDFKELTDVPILWLGDRRDGK